MQLIITVIAAKGKRGAANLRAADHFLLGLRCFFFSLSPLSFVFFLRETPSPFRVRQESHGEWSRNLCLRLAALLASSRSHSGCIMLNGIFMSAPADPLTRNGRLIEMFSQKKKENRENSNNCALDIFVMCRTKLCVVDVVSSVGDFSKVIFIFLKQWCVVK